MTRVQRVEALIAKHSAEWLREIRANAVACEARRPFTRKPERTGTISEAACLYLRGIVDDVRPKVCAEVGTFIGTSACVLASTGAHVFTCDKDNGCVESGIGLTAFQRTSSTQMFVALAGQRVKADLFFFDGRIQVEDLPLILRLSHQGTVYAFDDYEGREKGVVNVERLGTQLTRYRLVPPPAQVLDLPSRTTIALLEPAS